MPLTATQKTSIRRHLGYPVIGLIRTGAVGGGTLASGFAGYRYFQAYGALEYKMNNLAADEEARLIGGALGAIAIVGNPPNPGDSITVVFSGGGLGSPQTITATYPTPTPPGEGRLWFANQLAALALGNAAMIGAGMIGLAPYGTGPFAESAVPLPEVSFTGPLPFTMAATFSGQCAPAVTAQGGFVPPNTSLDGVNTIYGFLPICDGLENAWLTASANLDTIQADVWKGRSNEAGARRSLYEQWKRQMADFLGVPCSIDATAKPQSMGAMNFA
jgi:hypothetical protein